MNGEPWTNAEREFLRRNLGRMTNKEIACELGRPISTVREKVRMEMYEIGIGVQPRTSAPVGSTLCWECARAGSLHINAAPCSWQDDLPSPVKGWKAFPTSNGFHVNVCPKFVPDKAGRKK
jgi:hypothetical protein